MDCNLSFIFRHENKSSIDALLTEDSKRRRNRQKIVGIQMTMVSWFLELLTGVLMMILNLFGTGKGTLHTLVTDHYILVFIDVFLCGVLIPSTYILNGDIIKEEIVENGWRKYFCVPF